MARGNFINRSLFSKRRYSSNSEGVFLYNYNPVQERWILDSDKEFLKKGLTKEQIREAGILDGFEFTCPVDSYFPNEYKLYCIYGNVSEMVADKSVSKGGSWGSYRNEIIIESNEKFSMPNPYTGFRFIALKN